MYLDFNREIPFSMYQIDFSPNILCKYQLNRNSEKELGREFDIFENLQNRLDYNRKNE